MKGIGIILVVLSHTGGCPFGRWFGSWFTQLFFIIAGYTFNHKYSESIRGGRELLVKRVKRLYMPWIIINTVLNFLNNWLIQANILTDNPQLLTVKSTYVLDKVWSLNYFLLRMRGMILFQQAHKLAGPAWFLSTLFFVEIFYTFLEWICKKVCKENYIIYYDIILIIVYGGGVYLTMTGNTVNRYNLIGLSIFLFHMGCKIKEFDLAKNRFEPIFECFVAIATIFVFNKLEIGTIRYVRSEIQSGDYLLICSLAGWYLVYGISELILQSENIISKALIYIGNHTMPILLLHLISFKIVTYIQIIYYKKPIYMLGAFSVLYSSSWWWLAYGIIGIIVPLLLYRVHNNIVNWVKNNLIITKKVEDES